MKNRKNKRVEGGRSLWGKSKRVQLEMQYKQVGVGKGCQMKENINFKIGNDYYNIKSYNFIKKVNIIISQKFFKYYWSKTYWLDKSRIVSKKLSIFEMTGQIL